MRVCISPASLPLAVLVVAVVCSGLLSGCATQQTASPLPLEMPAGLHGQMKGGQQPVSNATVELVQISTAGYGDQSGQVLASAASDASGNFSLPSHTCPSANTPTLIRARGGNPGLAAGTDNPAIFLVAVTGPCSSLTPSTFVQINEVTTVASAFTLRPFMSGTSAGTSATNLVGIANAMSTYSTLVDNSTGTSPGANLPPGVSVPTALINTLANSLAACVNTASQTSTPCATVTRSTSIPTTGSLSNVFSAAVAIANSPALTTSHLFNLFNLGAAAAPFQPVLSAMPADFAITIQYSGGNLSSPHNALDIDQNGNVWVATGQPAGSIEEMAPSGTMLASNFLGGTVHSPAGIAIEPTGSNLIITSSSPLDPSVRRVTTGGTVIFRATDAEMDAPAGLVTNGTLAYVVNQGAAALFLVDLASGAVQNFKAEVSKSLVPAGGSVMSRSFHATAALHRHSMR